MIDERLAWWLFGLGVVVGLLISVCVMRTNCGLSEELCEEVRRAACQPLSPAWRAK